MNRERALTGSNGYDRELGLDILGFLTQRLGNAPVVRWLDLCCGSARALFHARSLLHEQAGRVEITGVDLVDHFAGPPQPPGLDLVTASVAAWAPSARFDLVTSVHGLHYIGDKLGTLTRAASWLAADGLLIANFDTRAVRLSDGMPAGRRLTGRLRRHGFDYDPARRRIRCQGHRLVQLPYRYIGADDHAGPNYTGQPAVNSHYEPTDS
jgi:SAM-dependent methyltransferase